MPDADSRPSITLLNGLKIRTPVLPAPHQLAVATLTRPWHFVARPAEEFDFAFEEVRTNDERNSWSQGEVARGCPHGLKSIRTSEKPQLSYRWIL
jgi:hypothetical protein